MGVKNRKNYINGKSHNEHLLKYLYKYESGNVFVKDYLHRVLETIHCKHAFLWENLNCYFMASVTFWIQFSSHMLAEAVMEIIPCWKEEAGNPEHKPNSSLCSALQI